jgi:membrane protease YdiL (CAAX protease family)
MTETKTLSPKPLEAAQKPKWGPVSAVLVTLGIYFGTQIVGLLPFLWYAEAKHLDVAKWIDDSVTVQFCLFLVIQSLTLLFLWQFMKLRGITLTDIGIKRPNVNNLLLAIPVWAVYFAILLVVIKIVSTLTPVNVNQEQQVGFQAATSGGALLLVFVSLVIMPAIVEEIMVRGFLYGGLRNKLPKMAAALLASLIFGAAHLQLGSGAPPLWVAAIDTFLLSIVLIWLREKTGNIYAGMLVHGLKNTLAFLSLFIFSMH